MDKRKRERLEKAGWKSGSAADFLRLTPEESAYVDLKLALADFLRVRRQEKRWTQSFVAKQLGSSQSRVAKMEAGDPSVSMDLLMRSLLVLGVTRKELGEVIASHAA